MSETERGGRPGRMNTALRWALGTLMVAVTVAGLGWGTRWEYEASSEDAAELRLSWRTRAPRVEECRTLTPEEQQALPAHMRREQICEGRYASYRLAVEVDGARVHEALVEGAGARGDRPLFVFRDVPLRPGARDIRIAFTRVGAESGDVVEGSDRVGEAVLPDSLILERTVELEPREVALVVYDPERRSLELVEGGE